MVASLKTLKRVASEMDKKVEETDRVLREIETVSQQYKPLLEAACSIYFTMDRLNQLHFLYQYSLQFFLDIFQSFVDGSVLLKEQDRCIEVTENLCRVLYRRVARGMLQVDRLTFALLVCRIHLRGLASEPHMELEFQHFLNAKDGVVNHITLPGNLWFCHLLAFNSYDHVKRV